MGTITDILPLAIAMMAGPQIISAVILITSKKAEKSSLAFIAAILLMTTVGTLVLFIVFQILGIDSLAGDDQQRPVAAVIETALIGILFFLAIRTYINRTEIKTPKWMESLQEAEPINAFKLGMTLILIMPTDVIIMTTVAIHLVSKDASFLDALPFILTTALIAALPLIIYTIFRDSAAKLMPEIRQWMNDYSWLVQLFVYVIFILLIWK